MIREPFIKAPQIPKILDRIIIFVENKIGKKMMPARLLLWTPKAFISSMILEGLVAHKAGKLSPRTLKLIRMQVSLLVTCPFCIDMNSANFRDYNISEEEVQCMQGRLKLSQVETLSIEEKLILAYIRGLIRTPIKHNPRVVKAMKKVFTEKEFATIVTTLAQVDYWTRVIQGFGIPPAGFLETCDLDFMVGKDS